MRHFINLKDIPAKDLRRILVDAKKRKFKRKKLKNAEKIEFKNEILPLKFSFYPESFSILHLFLKS